MKILVACEYSGRVRDAFIRRGHDAVSCDIVPSRAPGPHVLGNVLAVLDRGWDMMIAFPPCTHLCISGAAWFKNKYWEQAEALAFVQLLMGAPAPRIAIENPVGVISTRIRKPDQIVQPYHFGDEFSKKTCLWLKGLPRLTPTKIVGRGEFVRHGTSNRAKWFSNRERDRSETFPGIANAMAEQWG